MRLTVLGSGDAFSGCGCNAGYVIDGRLLVDAGAPVPAHLLRTGHQLGGIDTILVTHFHADHLAMLPIVLGALMVAAPSSRLTIAGPVGTREYTERLVTDGYGPPMNRLLGERLRIDHRTLQDGSDEMINGYRVRAHAVVHSVGPSLAYSVSRDGTAAGFSGDATLCAGLRRVVGESDLMVCECTGWEGPVDGHLWREEVSELIAVHPGTRFLLSHLTARGHVPGALVAHDLLSLEITPA